MLTRFKKTILKWATLVFHRAEKTVVRAALCKGEHLLQGEIRAPKGCASLMRQPDIEDIARLFGEDKAEAFSARLESGYGFKAVDNGEIVGYVFASSGSRQQEGNWPLVYDVPAREGVIYLFDFWVSPTVNKLETSVAMLEYAMSICCRMGCDAVFLTLDPAQDHLVSATKTLGFDEVGTLNFQSLLGVSRTDVDALSRL